MSMLTRLRLQFSNLEAFDQVADEAGLTRLQHYETDNIVRLYACSDTARVSDGLRLVQRGDTIEAQYDQDAHYSEFTRVFGKPDSLFQNYAERVVSGILANAGYCSGPRTIDQDGSLILRFY
jgi:hypothetical protein